MELIHEEKLIEETVPMRQLIALTLILVTFATSSADILPGMAGNVLAVVIG